MAAQQCFKVLGVSGAELLLVTLIVACHLHGGERVAAKLLHGIAQLVEIDGGRSSSHGKAPENHQMAVTALNVAWMAASAQEVLAAGVAAMSGHTRMRSGLTWPADHAPCIV